MTNLNQENTVSKLKIETDKNKRTLIFRDWLIENFEKIGTLYLINKKVPHTWFNISCKFFNPKEIQNIDWFTLFNDSSLNFGTIRVNK